MNNDDDDDDISKVVILKVRSIIRCQACPKYLIDIHSHIEETTLDRSQKDQDSTPNPGTD